MIKKSKVTLTTLATDVRALRREVDALTRALNTNGFTLGRVIAQLDQLTAPRADPRDDRPRWTSHEGTSGGLVRTVIATMTDTHLRNAINVCRRMDPRYKWDAARMVEYGELVRKSCKRKEGKE